MRRFVDGADLCRSNSDHLWHGKALEGIGVCLLLLAHLKVGFHIPTIPYPALDQAKSKPSPGSSKPSTPNPYPTNGNSSLHQQVLNILPELHGNITSLYQRASNFPGESIPHICYCEMVLRHTKMLTSMYLSNGISVDAVAHIVPNILDITLTL